jgi:hypothetical protein
MLAAQRLRESTLLALSLVLALALGCKGRPAAPPVSHKLVIDRAIWGAIYEGQFADVTERVRAKVSDDSLSVVANVFAFGDPVGGKSKQLRVEYKKGGVAGGKVVNEGQTLTIDHDEQPQPQRLVVTKALYGNLDGESFVDVTMQVADMVQGNKLSIGGYNSLFGDPSGFKEKQLRVDYTIDGQPDSKTVPENERMELSVSKPRP